MGAGHILRLSYNFLLNSKLRGFIVVAPLEGFLSAVNLLDGRHVEFLMAIPAFCGELDFAARYGVEDLREAMAAKEIPF
ncbi:suppressor of fused domain protein [Nonomuraea sp. NPDC049421]|uniref:suppressor of fused domain protein n=1 Tax=Nonomuraea sp. NPDC049421 TaxID=3155275 RepID=UPI00341380E7